MKTGSRRLISGLIMVKVSGSKYRYEGDGLGSITSLTEVNGSAARTYVYNSFGRPLGGTGNLTNPFY